MDSQYIIGITEMDEQHAKLFALFKKVRESSHDMLVLNKVVVELLDYANVHLDEEEQFLKTQGLNDFLRGHVGKHVLFRQRAMELYDSFRELADEAQKSNIAELIAQFCEDWLKEHINVEDRVYASLLKASHS